MAELDDVLGNEPIEPVVEVQPEPEKGEVIKEEPATPAEPPKEEPTKEEPADVRGLKAAVMAERSKRQALEAELAVRNAEPKPDFWEDPEARLTEIEQKFEQKMTVERLNISESFARDKYADFEEKMAIFSELVHENPAIYQTMLQQANPAEYAYKTSMQTQKLKDFGDPLAYEAKLRTEIEEKVKAEYEQKLQAELKKRNEIPGSLADSRSIGGVSTQAWSGPAPLSDILK